MGIARHTAECIGRFFPSTWEGVERNFRGIHPALRDKPFPGSNFVLEPCAQLSSGGLDIERFNSSFILRSA